MSGTIATCTCKWSTSRTTIPIGMFRWCSWMLWIAIASSSFTFIVGRDGRLQHSTMCCPSKVCDESRWTKCMRVWCQFGTATVHTGNEHLTLIFFFLFLTHTHTLSLFYGVGVAKKNNQLTSFVWILCRVFLFFVWFFNFNTTQISRLIQFRLYYKCTSNLWRWKRKEKNRKSGNHTHRIRVHVNTLCTLKLTFKAKAH